MAAVPEGPFPYRIAKESSTSSNPTDAVIFVGVCLVLGIASRHLLRGTKVPYTVALLILGIGIGSLEYGTNNGLGKIGDGIRLWANIDPDLLLAVFLPALLFESSFSMEVHQIKKCMVQMLLLAGPGVMISTFCLGSLLKLTFPYNWSWKTSLLLGGLLSATDPVAVVALLKQLGASKKLSTIIEGESLMNDGTAIVVYQLFYKMVLGQSFNWIAIVKFLSQVSLGAVGIGLAFGIASVLWLGFIFNDTVIEITLTLAVSYIAYFAAQEGADVSGVLTVMTLGMYYAAVARTAFKGDGQQSLHHFWEMVAYIANTLIFILSGVVIAEGVLGNHNLFGNNGKAWGYLILLYVFVQVSRIVVVGVLYPALCFFGYGLDLKEATILTWAGLRGAVALSLSLSVKNASGSSYLSSETGTLFVFFTGGIVFLTLIVNGSTTQFILHLLGMDKLSAAKRRILDYTRYEMLNKALEAFGDLGDDEELGPADWPTVKKYIASLNNVEGGPVHPHSGTESDNLDDMNLEDIRIRLLNGVQAAYWGMLDEGRITKTTANLLMQSVDEALDLVQHEPLCDWKGLKDEVHFPNYYKFLQTSICPQKLVTYFIVERLESACYICAAFLRAHRIARTQLHEFIGESEIASKVASESEAEGEEARKFLEDVRVTFPQVLRVVKTRQVTYSVLNHLINYVQNLEKVGLLEQKEMLHLHDAVQTDLKKFLRNPPLAKISKIRDLSSTHPLLDALPSPISDSLKGSSKEVMKMRGVTLFREGVKPNGVWLIFNGVVKWTSKSIRNKHSLHPTFMHGSTLGLYEVLTGKPYLCNMITESVAMCFFLETDNILSLLQSDPAIEDFLWQESAIILVRLLLPKIFEKMAMQELRALAVERSRMNIYIRGETIEIPQRSIGFLLEGFIKPQGVQEEIITPPAALLPPHVDHSFCSFEISGEKPTSFSHQGSWYEVETRARVIVFDMASVEAESGLQRWSSSRSQLGDRPPRLLSKEHGGLMSWPENFFIQKHHHQNHPERTDQHANSFSARAMQLSIFGSMVNMRRRATSFSKGSSQVNPSHSLSYPSAPSNHGRPLVSVRSEGSTTMRRNLDMRECAVLIPKPPLESTITNGNLIRDVSSDESDTEEHLVRIDSPSNLSFRRAS